MSGASKKLMGTTAVGGSALPIEDVFSTYVYKGNGAANVINNNLDLAGEGGMVWVKKREDTSGTGTGSHTIVDTLRGPNRYLSSNNQNAENTTNTTNVTGFTSSGFTLLSNSAVNNSLDNYVAWAWRKAPRFFDIQTWTGDGVNGGRQIPHDLGVAPGCIIVKRTDSTSSWGVYHRSLPDDSANETASLILDSTTSYGGFGWFREQAAQTDTYFTIRNASTANTLGATYVAYIFAHDPLGPSEDGSDGLIACGSYVGNGSNTGNHINIGWEAQFVLTKAISAAGDWEIRDTMREMPWATDSTDNASRYIRLNTTSAENTTTAFGPSPQGFSVYSSNSNTNANGVTYIYIAIRRGPMRQPEVGTDVFDVQTYTLGAYSTINRSFSPDLLMGKTRTSGDPGLFTDRVRGYIRSNAIASRSLFPATLGSEINQYPDEYNVFSKESSTGNYFNNLLMGKWAFRRAPGFMDITTWRLDGSGNQTVYHSLGVIPEMIIHKNRNNATSGPGSWWVAHKDLTGWDSSNENDRHALQLTNAASAQQGYHRDFTETSFRLISNGAGGYNAGDRGLAYLFATCPGVSKVGSFNPPASGQLHVDCGFTTGARFVLIKRTDATSSWFLFDTARGITTSTDPVLYLQSNAAEYGSYNALDPNSIGFTIPSGAFGSIFSSDTAAHYIFLAIA